MKKLLLTLLCFPLMAHAYCVGKFPNPISDICWDCIFPVIIAKSIPLQSPDGSQEDYNTGAPGPLCSCPVAPPLVVHAGLTISFWEQLRMLEVTRTPWCIMTLDATQLNMGIGPDMSGTDTPGNVQLANGGGNTVLRQEHWLISPWMTLVGAILGDNCLENHGFDIAYLSEADPTATDEGLDRLLNPEDYLLGGIIADATCVVDSVEADLGFPDPLLWWCDGTNGPTGNLTITARDNYGAVQASTCYVHKTAQKLFRLGMESAASGPNGLCGYYPQIVMDKRQWKYSMLYPVAQSQPDPFGHCCQPIGRTTMFWGSGRTYPEQGEDFVYNLFRKRDCCQSVSGAPGNY